MRMEHFDGERQAVFRLPLPPVQPASAELWLTWAVKADKAYAQAAQPLISGPVIVLLKWGDAGGTYDFRLLFDWMHIRGIAPYANVRGRYSQPVKTLRSDETEVRITSFGIL